MAMQRHPCWSQAESNAALAVPCLEYEHITISISCGGYCGQITHQFPVFVQVTMIILRGELVAVYEINPTEIMRFTGGHEDDSLDWGL